MPYPKELYKQADRRIAARREKAEGDARKRHDALAAGNAGLSGIESEMAKTGMEIARAVLSGSNVAGQIELLKRRNLQLQDQLKALLAANNLPQSYLEPGYTCKRCADTGSSGGRYCDCKRQLLKELACEQLNSQAPMALSSFSNFRLDLYPSESGNGISPRAQMSRVLDCCQKYAREFSPRSGGLLMYGKTGLGKTHLSLAIAGEVIAKGFGVVYGSAQMLLNKLQKEHFSRENGGDTEGLLTGADLLILDDLGAEFTTQFTVSAIYNLINSRMLAGKPTIINTNLTFKELDGRYGERIVSRLSGDYKSLMFIGRDMRQILAQQS